MLVIIFLTNTSKIHQKLTGNMQKKLPQDEKIFSCANLVN